MKTTSAKLAAYFILCISILTGCGGSSGGSSSTAGTAIPAGTVSFNVTAPNAPTSYLINSIENPSMTLQRGQTYTFTVAASGHPFYIMTARGANTANAYSTGVTGNGATGANVTFVVPMGAPNTLYYNCSNHAPMGGTINIID
jgi:hypothetical protein